MIEIVSFGAAHCIVAIDSVYHDATPGTHPPIWEYQRACTIRDWGTDGGHGLGQIAYHGPTRATILDAIPAGILVPTQSVHGIWRVRPDAAAAWIKAIEAAEIVLLKAKK